MRSSRVERGVCDQCHRSTRVWRAADTSADEGRYCNTCWESYQPPANARRAPDPVGRPSGPDAEAARQRSAAQEQERAAALAQQQLQRHREQQRAEAERLRREALRQEEERQARLAREEQQRQQQQQQQQQQHQQQAKARRNGGPELPAATVDKVPVLDTDYYYITAPAKDTECSICLEPYFDPVEVLPCAHIFCHRCIKGIAKQRDARCAQCRSTAQEYKRPHRMIQNIVNGLEVRCLRCGWNGEREGLVGHSCTHVPIETIMRDVGRALFTQGRFVEAIEEYTRGIDGGKDKALRAVLLCNRSLCRFNIGDYQQSFNDADLAAGIDSNNVKARFRRAAAAKKLDHPTDAIDADLLVAVGLDPTLQRACEELSPTTFGNAKAASPTSPKKATPPPPPPSEPAPTPAPVPQPSPSKKAQETRHADPTADDPATACDNSAEAMWRISVKVRWALLRLNALWKDRSEAFVSAYTASTIPERQTLLRRRIANLPERAGGTMDRTGKDVTFETYIAPELNTNDLSSALGMGFVSLVDDYVRKGFEDILDKALEFIHKTVFDNPGEVAEYLLDRVPQFSETGDVRMYNGVDGSRLSGAAVETTRTAMDEQEFLLVHQRLLQIVGSLEAVVQTLVGVGGNRNPLECEQCQAALKRKHHVCPLCRLPTYCDKKCYDKGAEAHRLVCGTTARALSGKLGGDAQQGIKKRIEDAMAKINPSFVNCTMEDAMKAIKATTDINKCMHDMYGDGDQSFVKGDLPSDVNGCLLRSAWASGMDAQIMNPAYPEFHKACYCGSYDTVLEFIKEARASGTEHQLVNYRWSLMRFSPLHSLVHGRRELRQASAALRHDEVAELLLESGANPNAKDIAGYTVVHHCTTMSCNLMTVELLFILKKYGANANLPNRFGYEAIYEPIMSNNIDGVKALMQIGAEVGKASQLAMMNPAMHEVLTQSAWCATLVIGSRVVLEGLVSAAHLNGKPATIVGMVIGKYDVRLDGNDDPIRVSMQKVRPARVCAQCAKVLSPQQAGRCSKCKAVEYCGGACQAAHWPQHKTQCVPPRTEDMWRVEEPDTMDRMKGMYTMSIIGGDLRDKTTIIPGTFIVKLQIPMSLDGDIPDSLRAALGLGPGGNNSKKATTNDGSGNICLYDQHRKLVWQFNARQCPDYFRIVNAVKQCPQKLKGYFNAEFKGRTLVIDPRPQPSQPW